MTNKNYPIKARVWLRESTQEWVLELSGEINDTRFNIRYTEPSTTRPEDVPAAPHNLIEELLKELEKQAGRPRVASAVRASQVTQKPEETEAKLTKAVEALNAAVKWAAWLPWAAPWVDDARAVLAELEGK